MLHPLVFKRIFPGVWFYSLALFCCIFSWPAWALVNNSDTLYVAAGETITLANEVYKNVSITVKSGGTINVIPHDGALNIGKVSLIAPKIVIEGTIDARGCGHDTRGQGGTPTGTDGGGGGGYGGAGGAGGGNHTGVGGATYDTPYSEDPGSFGYKAGVGTTYGGYGGGAIRIDAMTLTVGATAILRANGRSAASYSGGGGSGGSILLNSIQTFFISNYQLLASGGDGAAWSNPYMSGGGGGGGRIKIFEHNAINYQTGTMTVAGGAAGGSSSYAGQAGVIEKIVSPAAPSTPLQISPSDSQVVGTQPTFTFMATDPGSSKFLQYQLAFSTPNYTSVTFTVDQRYPDSGWSGTSFLSSGAVGSYTLPSNLAFSTTYYWRVRVTNNQGKSWSAWSSYRALTTTATPNDPPVPPQLLVPSADQTLVSKTPLFKVLGADPEGETLTFSILLSTDHLLQNARMFQAAYGGWNQAAYTPGGAYVGVTAECQVLNSGADLDALAPGTDYYWKAIAYDVYQQSRESGIGHFQTVPLPNPPTVVSPADQSIVTLRQPTLSLASQSPTGGTLAYKIELSPDGFQTILLFESLSGGGWSQATYASGETASLLIPSAYPLLSGSTYQWRGYAYDTGHDNWSQVTPNFSFTVVTPPLQPQLISPGANYSAPNSRIQFSFLTESESGNTVSGRIELSQNQFATVWHAFDQSVAEAGWSAPAAYASGEVMTFSLPEVGLEQGQTYWWRAQAYDGISRGPYSETRSFRLTDALEICSLKTVPNPAAATSELQLRLVLSADATIRVRFFNQLGREIGHAEWLAVGGLENVWRHDISSYGSGVYFYILEAQSEFGHKKEVRKFAVVK